MYKLIALDLDGTLLASDKRISEQNQQAIAKARAAGVTVVLASGRPIQGMVDKLELLGINSDRDFVLCYNGSMVQNIATGEVIHQQIIDGKAAKKVARKAKALGVYCHAFSTELGLITTEHNPYTQIETDINGTPATEMNFESLEDDHPIIKVMMVGPAEKITQTSAAIDEQLRQEFNVVQSAPYFLEFLNPLSNKGIGVAAIAEYLNIPAEQVIAMGDAENDHHMLRYAGLGIAMSNAMEETKQIADHITISNDEHGVAHCIEQFIFNQ
ncbi:Cof-type HAD-IIB family hydrolase [Vibrio sp. WXL210]|uniref:Cof-type HAD-IIB family hydrolase n=1 Tax=Vibrio sp. WXL210 TaxID=3450709 RepID=UPI003EC53B6C